MRFLISWRNICSLMLAVVLAAALSITTLPMYAQAQTSTASLTLTTSVSSKCKATVLRQGNSGTCVKEAQKALILHGFSVGKYGADGSFGKLTSDAVYKFQKAKKLERDRTIGPKTWRELAKTGSGAVAAPPPKSSNCDKQVIRLGSRGDCVKEFQKLLIERGEWIGKSGADGSFGNNSLRGLLHYQDIRGLDPDGFGGPKTWADLRSGRVNLSHLDARCFEAGERICTDKSDEKTYIMKSGKLIKVFPSRVGGWFYHESQKKWKKGNTPNGAYSIKYNVKDDSSAMYDDTPMYYSRYFTWQGHAIHGSDSFEANGNYRNKKGKAGSGGCVNLMKKDAKWLWNNVSDRAIVIIQS